MTKTNWSLSFILIAQIALGIAIYWPKADASGDGPLFADLADAEIVQLAITDQVGKQVMLTQSGDDWVLSDAGQGKGLSHRTQ